MATPLPERVVAPRATSLPAMLLAHEEAREVDFAAGDMAVDVDGAGHDHEPAEIDTPAGGLIGRRGRDAAILDEEIADLALDAVCRSKTRPPLNSVITLKLRDGRGWRRQRRRGWAERSAAPR